MSVYQPGTRLTVGSHSVQIIEFISEGGFATVYTCQIAPRFHGAAIACLKRVEVPNKVQLLLLRQEVDAMKRLRGNTHIVSYIDSHASRMPATGGEQRYEVLLLMEYCSGSGLINLMNQRLQHRLTEREVLAIGAQITTGVAMCHHLRPPLLHRDIKIENVLIAGDGTYKLCDFGSAVPFSPAPVTPAEASALHNDIMHYTTPQYRAPEMVSVGQFPVDDKLDVWALGCFLYKLCYYTTPFELPLQKNLQDLEAAILRAEVRFPLLPKYSSRLQYAVQCCLRKDPRRRPLALQLLQELCQMQNMAVPDVVPHAVKELAHAPEKRRPKSMYESSETRLTPSLQHMIQQKVLQLSNELQSMRGEDLDGGTLDFLKLKDDAPSRQNTGGSFKSSIKNGLRRISTGSSVAPQRSGLREEKPLLIQKRMSLLLKKRHSDYEDILAINYTDLLKSLSSLSSGDDRPRRSSERKSFDRDRRPLTTRRSSEKSWRSEKSRSSENLRSSDKSRRSSERAASERPERKSFDVLERKSFDWNSAERLLDRDILELEKNRSATSEPKPLKPPVSKPLAPSKLLPPLAPKKVLLPLVPKKLLPSPKKLLPPVCPPSLGNRSAQKKPPPKPKKPLHLAAPQKERRVSSSSLSIPDLDDLEKQFAKRFPSYV